MLCSYMDPLGIGLEVQWRSPVAMAMVFLLAIAIAMKLQVGPCLAYISP